MASLHESVIGLVVKLSGQASIDALSKSTENYKKLLEDLTGQFQRGDVDAATFERAASKISTQLQREEKLLGQLRDAQNEVTKAAAEAADAQRQLAHEFDAVELAMEDVNRASSQVSSSMRQAGSAAGTVGSTINKASDSSRKWVQVLNQTGFALDDLQYGFRGVGNNIQPVLGAIPGFGQWAAIIAIAATGAYQLFSHWDSLTRLFETKQAIPHAAHDVEALKNELEKAKEETKKLEENTTLTTTELARYNELRATTARLEKEVADQTERQQRLKKALEAPSSAEQDRAKAFGEAIDGKGRDVLNRLARAYAGENRQAITNEKRRAGRDIDQIELSDRSDDEKTRLVNERKRQSEDLIKTLSGSTEEIAKDLFDGLLRGQENAVKKLRRLASGGTGVNLNDVVQKFDSNTSEGKAKTKRDSQLQEDDWDDWIAEEVRANKEAEKAKKAQQRDDEAEAKRSDRATGKAAREAKAKQRKGAAQTNRVAAADARSGQEFTRDVISATNIDEQAAVESARMRAQGGYQDASGTFVRADRDQQNARLTRMIQAELERRGIAKQGTARNFGASVRIADAAEKKANETLQAVRQGQENDGQLGNNQAIMLQTIDLLVAQAQKQGEQIRQLGNRAADSNARARTLLNRGR